MIMSARTSRGVLRGVAIPMCAAIAFTFSLVASPKSDGSFGINVVEAKGKGGGRGGKTLKMSTRDGKERGSKLDLSKEDRALGTDRWREGDSDEHHYRDREHNHGRDSDRSGQAAFTGEDDPETARSWGATASELRHRNAAQASESGFRHASPDSNVGRIATYRDAAQATLDKEADIDILDREIETLRRQRSLAISNGYYETADDLDAEILRLEGERNLAEDDLNHLRVAEDDAYHAVGGPELDEHDYDVFRRMLGLD